MFDDKKKREGRSVHQFGRRILVKRETVAVILALVEITVCRRRVPFVCAVNAAIAEIKGLP